MSSDALLLMRAISDHAKGTFRNFSGNLPNNPDLAVKFMASGFFAGFAKPPKGMPPARGIMRRKSDIFVASEIAGDLVTFAMKNADVPHAVAEASYKNLVELMGNTRNHAAGDRRTQHPGRIERWHASVYCEKGVASFNFVDLGIGVLRSTAPRTFLRSIRATLLGYGQPQLLRDTFQGIIGASAHIPGRGFGLTRMREAADVGLLPNLRILTLSVKGEVAGLRFHESKPNFRGTVFRWMSRAVDES